MKKLVLFLLLQSVKYYTQNTGCNCSGSLFSENYSNSSQWAIQNNGDGIGSAAALCPLNSHNGRIIVTGTDLWFDAARDGVTNRVYKPIPTLNNTNWTADFTFELVNTPGNRPTYLPSHRILLFSQNSNDLTSGTLNGLCASATSAPVNNDAIWVSLECNLANASICPATVAGGSSNNNFYFQAHSRKAAGAIVNSSPIFLTGSNTYYIRLQRTTTSYGTLSVFTDPQHTNLLQSVCFDIQQNVSNLNYLQHSVGAAGGCERTLNAKIRNLLVSNSLECPPTFVPTFALNNRYCFGDQIAAVPNNNVVSDSYYWLIEECDLNGNLLSPHYQAATNTFTGQPAAFTFSIINLFKNGGGQGPWIHPLQCNMYYKMTLFVKACGVTSQSSQVFYIACPPQANAGPDKAICLGNSVQIGTTNIGGYSYSWLPTTGLSNPNISNPIASPSSNTNYTLTVLNHSGCSSTDVVNILVRPLPNVNAGPDQLICGASGVVTLGNLSNNPYNCSWTPGPSSTSFFIQNFPICTSNYYTCSLPKAAVFATTVFTLTATDQYGCIGTDQATITVNPLPIADAGLDHTICIIPNIIQTAHLGGTNTSSGNGYTYSWLPTTGLNNSSIQNPLASPNSTTVYTLTVTYTSPSGQTCTASDQVTVTVGNPIANAGPDQNICFNVPGYPQSAQIGSNASGGNSVWTPNYNLVSNTSVPTIAAPQVNTTYILTVTDPLSGCQSTDAVNVTVACPSPIALAGSNQIQCCSSNSPNPIKLIGNATSGVPPYSFSWNPQIGVIGGTSQSPLIDLCKVPGYGPGSSLIYTLTVTDFLGNKSTDIVTVSVFDSPIADAGSDQTVCCTNLNINTLIGGTPLGIGPSAIGGTPPYTYNWAHNIINPTSTFDLYNLSSAHPLYLNSGDCKDVEFTLTVTDNNGCTSTDVVNVSIDLNCRIINSQINTSTNSSKDLSKKIGISPSPSNGSFTIKTEKAIEGATIEVRDVVGKSIYKKQYSTLQNEQLDLSEVKDGIYFINITDAQGLIETKKIIKQQ